MKKYFFLILLLLVLGGAFPLISWAENSNFVQQILSGFPSPTSLPSAYTTEDNASPEIKNVEAKDANPTSLKLRWETSESAKCDIGYWPLPTTGKPDYQDGILPEKLFNTYHLVAINLLEPHTAYRFALVCRDSAGNESASKIFDTETPDRPDIVAPAEVADLRVENGDGRVTLQWENPADLDFAGVIIVRSEKKYPSSLKDGVKIFAGLRESLVNYGLENGKIYYYLVATFDQSGNYSDGVLAFALPSSSFEAEIILPASPPLASGKISAVLSISDFEFWQKGLGAKYELADGVRINYGEDVLVTFPAEKMPEKTAKMMMVLAGQKIIFHQFELMKKDEVYATLISADRLVRKSAYAIQFLDGGNNVLLQINGVAEVSGGGEGIIKSPRSRSAPREISSGLALLTTLPVFNFFIWLWTLFF